MALAVFIGTLLAHLVWYLLTAIDDAEVEESDEEDDGKLISVKFTRLKDKKDDKTGAVNEIDGKE